MPFINDFYDNVEQGEIFYEPFWIEPAPLIHIHGPLIVGEDLALTGFNATAIKVGDEPVGDVSIVWSEVNFQTIK